MKQVTETKLTDTEVMFVAGDSSKPIPYQAKPAFLSLESAFKSLKRRKFYGVVIGNTYHACSTITDEDRESNLPHPTMTIPGGIYATIRINDWEKHTNEIGPSFETLLALPNVDHDRPVVEFYQSEKVLLLMVPVNP